jgi:hypothetical protein
MKHLLESLAAVAILVGAGLAIGSETTAAGTASLKFGMGADSIAAQTAAGVKPDYGTFWIGPWTINSWGGPDAHLDQMRSAGVTPAIHFYYWGDDITPSCIENGCWSSLHNAQKDKAHWQVLAQQLVDHLNTKMQGKPVLILVETEFNKGGASTYEPLDGYLAEKANFFHREYPAARVVVPFGNWDSGNWGNFDRFAAASDAIGLQGMRASTKNSLTSYMGLYDATLTGTKKLQTLFGKPVILDDLALSSYPEPEYLQYQKDAIGKFFTGLPALKASGVEAIIYRSWLDAPNMNLANYFGEAERHWGFQHASSKGGAIKPAAQVWVDGVKAERGPPNQAPTASFVAAVSALTVSVDASASSDPEGKPLTYAWTFGDGASATGRTASHAYAAGGSYVVRLTVRDGLLDSSATKTVTVAPPPFTATFAPTGGINEWWVEVKVTASSPPTKVQAQANGGAWQTLAKTSYGTWAKSFNVPKGSSVVFKATSATGATVTSPAFQWIGPSPTPTSTSTSFAATFTPKGTTNNWWVETAVKSSETIAKVEAREDGGAWTVLPKNSWGLYSKSLHIEEGHKVQFRATSSSGATAISGSYTWS